MSAICRRPMSTGTPASGGSNKGHSVNLARADSINDSGVLHRNRLVITVRVRPGVGWNRSRLRPPLLARPLTVVGVLLWIHRDLKADIRALNVRIDNILLADRKAAS